VEKPDKIAHDKELEEFAAEIKAIQDERQGVQDKIDGKTTGGGTKNNEISAERDALAKLRAQKGNLIDEKKKLLLKLDAIKAQGDKIAKDRKDTRANIKFSKVEDIDKELARLKKKQETTSMSLSEEKKILKEIDQLKASKSLVASLKSKDTDLEGVKEQRKNLTSQVALMDKDIDAVQSQINEKMATIKALTEKESGKRDALKELFAKRDDLRKQMNDVYKKRDDARAAFRVKNDAWYTYKRAVAAQKKMEYEAEKKKREEEQAAWLKMKEEEEAKKIPYEEEQNLCEYLAEYLTRTYLADKDAEAKKTANEANVKKSAGILPLKEDPFAKFQPVKKADDEEYFGKGKGKKKRDRSKKKEEKAISGPLTLNVDSFEQFALIGLTPPTTLEQVSSTVEQLKARKIWYSEQPRGSVPTATEIRKASEKAASKLRSNNTTDNGNSSGTSKTKSDTFSLSVDDFVPLSTVAAPSNVASSMNASWGQPKSLEEETAIESIPLAE
jgi:chromosome segregation ATPase